MSLDAPSGFAPSLLVLAILACTPPASLNQQLSLIQVERSSHTSSTSGHRRVIPERNGGIYEDAEVRVLAIAHRSTFTLTIHNKTAQPIRMVWDRAVFVDAEGVLSRVMPLDTGSIGVSQPHKSLTIPAQASVTATAIPASQIHEGAIEPFFALADSGAFANLKGRHIRLVVPLEVQGVVTKYTLVFEIRELSVSRPL